jgi:hypothetical protein
MVPFGGGQRCLRGIINQIKNEMSKDCWPSPEFTIILTKIKCLKIPVMLYSLLFCVELVPLTPNEKEKDHE